MNNFTQSFFTSCKKSFKKSLFFTLLLTFFVGGLSFGQTDDFTDGNFTASPVWSGDTGSYSVVASTTAGSATTDGSYLAANASVANTTLTTSSTEVSEWKFSLGTPNFDPSSANFFGVVLMSNVAITGNIQSTSWNGYYLKIGVNSTPDPIELWVKNGAGTGTKVGDFPTSPSYSTGALQNGLNLRITRSAAGVFELFYSTGFQYTTTPAVSAGTVTNNLVTTSSFFGIYNVFGSAAATRRVFIDNIVLGTPPVAITSAQTGIWSANTTWVGGIVPTSTANVIIAAGHVVTLDTATGGINTRNAGTTTIVNASGTLATNVTYTNNGTTTIDGTFQINQGGFATGSGAWTYGTSSTLVFNHTSGAYGLIDAAHTYWPAVASPTNVTVANAISGGINLGVSRTVNGVFQTSANVQGTALNLNGIVRINSGGSFNSSPIYGSASTLTYNTGANFTRGNEWTSATSGAGYPANVQLTSPSTITTLNMGSTTAQCSGNITVDLNTILNTTSAVLTAIGSVTVNGTINLNGDVTTQGNWTIGAAGVQNNNGKAVSFTAPTGNQTITKTGVGTVFFDYLLINKNAGNVVLSSAPATNVTINTTSGNVLQLNNAGNLDINGQTLTLNNAGGNISTNATGRTITSGVAGGILAITGNKSVVGDGTLVLGANVTTILTAGLDFGSNKTTVNGILQINNGGFANTNAPIYAATSTLVYNGVSGYGVGNEWTGNAIGAGDGTPQNVTLTSSSVNMPSSIRSLAGNLTIGAGSALALNTTFGSDLNIGGNWINSGTFTPNNRLVEFRGVVPQTITGATTFDFLTQNNSTLLTLQASSPVTVNQTLALTSGRITLGVNNLTVNGTITGQSASNYVQTSSTGQLRRTVGASAIVFPVGNTAYNPITFNNSGTSDIYGVRVANVAPAGINPTKTVTRQWITTEAVAGGSNLAVVAQYNNGETGANFGAATNNFIGFYNGTTWAQAPATQAGADPFTASSNTNLSPSNLTAGTQYFAIGRDNAFVSVATTFAITAITPASPGAGYGFNVTVQSQDAFGTPSNVTSNTAFTLSTNGNAGTIGGTVTGTILAGTNTIVVSGVTLATAGTGVTLTATQTSGDALAQATSSTFTVLAAASQLAFGIAPPATGNVGVNLTSFTVEARRPDATVDTFFTGNITIAKVLGTGNLSGTLTVAAVAGVATFTTAQFDAASTYTLLSTSGSLTSVTSDNIVITLQPTVIAQFDFTPFSLPTADDVTFKDTNVSVSDFAISSGLLSVGSNIGTDFPNEPFVSGSGGYTATTQATAKNFNFNISSNIGYEIEVTSIQFNALSTNVGPSAISFDIASGASLFTANAPNTILLAVNQTVSGVANLTSVPVLIQGWLNGSRPSTGGGNFRIDDVIVKGFVTCKQPIAYTVTGGGAYCTGGSGSLVGLSNSELNINYQLKNGATNVGAPVAGTGSAISFGNQTTAATYTVEATNTNGTCNLITTMTGSAIVTLDPLSDAGTVSANQTICSGSQPSDIILTGSVGTIQWQSSTDNVAFTAISGQTSAILTGVSIGALTSTTYYRAVVTSGFCSAATSATVTVLIETTTWTAALGGSWDNGLPTSTKSAVISFDYAVASDLTACSLTVNNNAVVTIPTGFNVTLNGAITVSSGSFTLNNNANLIQLSNVSNTGNITVKRNSNALKRNDYILWSAPVAGQNLFAFSPLTLTNRFYTYTTSSNLYSLVPYTVGNTTTFTTAKGYLIRVPNNHPTFATIWNGSFSGIPNNGTIPAALTSGGVGFRFNAIGNPYPSTVSMLDFVTANTVLGDERITGTLYFWRKTNSTITTPGYCTWAPNGVNPLGTFVSNNEAQVFDPNGILQVGQGFIVEATAGATSLNFTNAMRTANNANQTFRSQATTTPSGELNRIWLNATSTTGEFSQMAFGYMTGATLGEDIADAKFFNDGSLELSTLINSNKYVIQSRPVPFDASDVVPLNFKSATAGSYTIALDHVDGLFSGGIQPIFLKDNNNNTFTDLNMQSYTFTATSGEFANRFEIVYQAPLGIDNPVLTENNVIVFKQDNSIAINSGNVLMASVKIFDIRGRLLQEKSNINASETKMNAGNSNQVLLVQITSTDGKIVTKKVVN